MHSISAWPFNVNDQSYKLTVLAACLISVVFFHKFNLKIAEKLKNSLLFNSNICCCIFQSTKFMTGCEKATKAKITLKGKMFLLECKNTFKSTK